MCGLVLLVTKNSNGFNTQQQDIFTSLLYLSGGFRGRDGAGVVVIGYDGNLKLAKEANSVDHFQNTEEFNKLNAYAYRKGIAMMGHNRAATRGNIKDENAHPFVIDDKIVLMHNGTFYGSHKHIKDTEVDSEAIGHLLAETDDPAEALKKINAAFALVWYNVGKREINIVRNTSRPLYYMETASSHIYASEMAFLNFVKEKYTLEALHGPYLIAEHNLNKYIITSNREIETDNIDLDCDYTKHNPTAEWEGDYVYKKPAPYSGDDYYSDIFKKVVAVVGDKLTSLTHGEWDKVQGKYAYASDVRVTVQDFIEDSFNGGRDYLVVGKTLDKNAINVVFKLYNKTQEEILSILNHTEFSVTASKLIWKRADELFPIDVKQPMDDWPGIPLLQTYNPQPVLLIENNEH